MESRFYHDDFEELIKQKADQYKMYPSEDVWKSVHRSIHPRRKWYWFGFAFLLTGIGYYAVHELTVPASPILATNQPVPIHNEPTVIQPSDLIPFSFSGKNEIRKPNNHDIINQDQPIKNAVAARIISIAAVVSLPENMKADLSSSAFDIPAEKSIKPESITRMAKVINPSFSGNAPIEIAYSSLNHVEIRQPEAKASRDEDPGTPRVNWLQEYAANQFYSPGLKKLGWQLFFSPTMNYRKLSGNSNAVIPSEVKYIPMSLSIKGDLDRLVNHKPALGFELGSALFYKLDRHLSLKGGLQFNYSRYNIEAYSGSSEIATIALTNEYGYQTNSLSSVTQIRNFGGRAIKDIQNQYFQFSTPIGIEWKILGSDRFQLNISGTIQPTYLLNRNTYLITTDYKNYTREPSLVRRWNINTAAEAYIAYKTGGVSWQIGPQFRYQLLSSYTKQYPIKEYLMEYGLKFGVTKTIR